MEWQLIETAPTHDRHKDGSTNQPHVIGHDGKRVGEARHYDGQWHWMDHGEANLIEWQPMPVLPERENEKPGSSG